MDSFRTVDELLHRHDVKRAEVLIARLLRSEISIPERAELLVARAHARLLTARAQDALDDLEQVRTLYPDALTAPTALELLGDCYFARFELASVGFADRNDTAQALAAYDRILSEFPAYPNRGWIIYQRGRVLLTENRRDEASACFEQALNEPSQLTVLAAYCHERLGFIAFYEHRDPDAALQHLDAAIITYPAEEDNSWLVHVHTLRSRVLRETQQYEAAVEAANNAIVLAKDKAVLSDALLNAAETLALMDGREREVIAHLQQFTQIGKKPLGIDVTWSRIQEMLGDALYKTGQLQAAVAAYEASFQFNPYTPWELSLHYRIARTLYQLNDYTKCVQAVQKMLRTAEADEQAIGDYRVYAILGNANFALEHYLDAVAAYELALEIAPAGADIEKIKQYYQFAQALSPPV